MDQLSIFDTSSLKNDDPIYQQLNSINLGEEKEVSFENKVIRVSHHKISGSSVPVYEYETDDKHELVTGGLDELYRAIQNCLF